MSFAALGGVIAEAAAKATDQAIGLYQYNKNLNLSYDQMNMQREFAQNGIRWRVADAKAAGIHPLVALGAQTVSPSGVAGPQQTGTDFASIGQSFERAKEAKALEDERLLNSELTKANIRKVNAETDFVQQQANNAKVAVAKSALPPPMPKANGDSSNGVYNGGSIVRGSIPLLGTSRLGNSLFLHYNTELADAISEDKARSIAADIATAGQMNRLLPEIAENFSPEERRALARGDAKLHVVSPYQVQLLYHEKFKPRRISKHEFAGKILPY